MYTWEECAGNQQNFKKQKTIKTKKQIKIKKLKQSFILSNYINLFFFFRLLKKEDFLNTNS